MRFNALMPLVVALGLSATGCAVYSLDMTATKSPRDETSVSPDLANRAYNKIMALPPSGTTRGEFDFAINVFEREFLKRNITVISSAITGRVVMDAGGSIKKDESAQGLSDAERALVMMAKGTGADAILQIGSLRWDNAVGRWFVLRDSRFVEVPQEEFSASSSPKYYFTGPELVFVGRLTDVETGQVMASFSIRYNTTWDLPADYHAQLAVKKGKPVLKGESWGISTTDWNKAAQDRVLEKAIAIVAARITSR